MRRWDMKVVETQGLISIVSGPNAPAQVKVVLNKANMKELSTVYNGCFHVNNVKSEIPQRYSVEKIEGGFNPVNSSIVLESVAVDAYGKNKYPEFRLLLTKTTYEDMRAELEEMQWLMDRVILRSMRHSAGLGLMQRQFVRSNLQPNIRRRLRQYDDDRKETIRLKHELQSSIRRNEDIFKQVRDLLEQCKKAEGPKLRQMATRSSRLLNSIV